MKNKINLVIFIEGTFLPAFDGYSLTMSNICEILGDTKYINLVLVHCYRGWTDIKILKKKKYKIILVSPDIYYHNTQVLAKLLKDDKPDIIQMQDAELILSQGVRLSNLYGCKLLYHPHYIAQRVANKLSIETTFKKAVAENERLATYYADYIFCFTKYDQDYFAKMWKGARKKIAVVPPAISNEQTKFRPIEKNRKNLIFIGNLFFQPNMDALLILLRKIYPKIKDTLNKFYIIGDAPKNSLHLYQKNKKILFMGKVRDIHRYLRISNLAIFPILEASGIRTKILTCFATGVPVLGYKSAFEGIEKSKLIKYLANEDCDIIKKSHNLLADINKQRKISKAQKIFFDRYFRNSLLKNLYLNKYKLILDLGMKEKSNKYLEKFNFLEPAWLQEFKLKRKSKYIYKRLTLPLKINF